MIAIALLAYSAMALAQLAGAESNQPPALRLRLETRIRYVNIGDSDKPLRADVTIARAIASADLTLTPRLKATVAIIHSDFLPPKR